MEFVKDRVENIVGKEEILVTSIFSISRNVSKKLLSEGCLTLSQTSPCFLRVHYTSVLKTLWEKEKLLITSNFSFSHNVFYPFVLAIFIKLEIVVCKIFQFRRIRKLSFGKGILSEYCFIG